MSFSMTQNNSTSGTTSATDVETTNLPVLDPGQNDVTEEIAVALTTGMPDENDHRSRMENAENDDPSKKEQDGAETTSDATLESEKPSDEANTIQVVVAPSSGIIVSSSKKARPQYKYDPEKITLRFLFANRDGLTVTVECKPSDTVGEVKGALISVWPKDMPCDSGGDNLRLICMGKGYLSPDSRTLADCQIPVFKTHPTPINVSVKPSEKPKAADGRGEVKKKPNGVGNSPTNQQSSHAHAGNSSSGAGRTTAAVGSATETSQGCGCVIQ